MLYETITSFQDITNRYLLISIVPNTQPYTDISIKFSRCNVTAAAATVNNNNKESPFEIAIEIHRHMCFIQIVNITYNSNIIVYRFVSFRFFFQLLTAVSSTHICLLFSCKNKHHYNSIEAGECILMNDATSNHSRNKHSCAFHADARLLALTLYFLSWISFSVSHSSHTVPLFYYFSLSLFSPLSCISPGLFVFCLQNVH